MRRRLVPVIVVVAVVAAALIIFIVLRRLGPPEAARLLPEADGVVYVDVSLLRHLGVFASVSGAPEEPEYADFVRATGFHFERDLDEAAFALHAAPGRDTYPRFSEVFLGRYDADALRRYLQRLAKSTEPYRATTVYGIPHEGRTVRVALLGTNLAAASNTDSAEPIHHIIDQYRRAALPFRGPSLLASEYRRVPFASLAWSIARIAPAPPATGPGLTVQVLRDLTPGAVLVASLRLTTKVELQVEAAAENEAHARQIADNVEVYLNLFRASRRGRAVAIPT